MKTLFAVTTYNQLGYTKKFISSYEKIDGIDLRFYDDVSTDGTQKFIKSLGYKINQRSKPRGLTYSWNLAYKDFLTEGYDVLIISNNDVLFNKDAILNLIKSAKENGFAVPLSTKRGAGHNWKEQWVGSHYPDLIEISKKGVNQKTVNSHLNKKNIHINRFNGFMFAMSSKIKSCQFNKEFLFNPNKINVGQESDLGQRLQLNNIKPILSMKSFIFHFKGVSFNKKGLVNGKDIRQNLNLYH